MSAFRSLLLLLVLLLITLTLLLVSATGVGLLLDRLLPGVGLGMGMLIGVVALSISAYVVLGLFSQANAVREELDEAELEELVTAMHRPARQRRSRR
jgi:uncharacterized membrane protein